MAYNLNKTTSSGVAVGMQTWCDKIMLERQKTVLVHDQGAVRKPIPANSGKVHQMRRWTPLPVVIADLTLEEGVIPDGVAFTEEEVLAYIYQYGAYGTKTDLFDLTHMDADTAEIADLLGQQGSELKDMVIREEMATTTTVQYANSKTAIYNLQTTDEINVDEVRKMVRTLKQNKTKPFSTGGRPYYMAIIGPEAEFDIQSDTKWINVGTYSDKEKIYNGEIGKLYGVKFLYTTECKKYENDNLTTAGVSLTCASVSTKTITVAEAITSDEATALVGRYVNLYDVSEASYQRHLIASAVDGAAGSATVTVTDSITGGAGASGDILYANEYGYTGNTVYTTFVFGQHAYSVGGIKGSDKIKSMVTPREIIGGPLRQFGALGWKIEGMSVKVLQPLWIGQIEHGASA